MHIIQALGKLRDREAVHLLTGIASGKDADARPVALIALAEVGDPAAADTIRKAAKSAKGYEREIATAAWVLLGRRLTETGQRDSARRVYREILAARTVQDDPHARCAAVRGLTEIDGVKAMPDVAKAQLSDDFRLRAAATAAAVAVPGKETTSWWIQRAGSKDLHSRVGALEVLGRRKDGDALPAVEAGLTSKHDEVRMAAIVAAGDLGDIAVVPALVRALGAEDEDERSVVRESLLRMPRVAGSRAIARSVKDAPAPVRAQLLEILAVRGATVYLDTVVACLDDADRDVRGSRQMPGFLGQADLGLKKSEYK